MSVYKSPINPRDQEYSNRFWSRGQPPGLREVMMEAIRKSAEQDGFIGSFVDPTGIKEKDREKLSAYRVLAEEMGYEVGRYKFNKGADTAEAPIKKRHT